MRPFILAAALLAAGFPALGGTAACAADLTPDAVQAFLATRAHMPGVTMLPSGLQIRVLKTGIGRHVAARDTVQIYYTARLADGRVVDGTSPGLPAPVDLGGTLAGLGEALQTMREGDHCELTLPPALAFGAKGGGGGAIAPNQPLVFDVTVVATRPAAMGGADQSNGFSITAGNGESHAHFTVHP